GDSLLEALARHDQIDHAVFQQELRTLKLRRELLLDGLLDDARAGEPDEGLGLGQDDVRQHRETSRHAPEGRVGEDGARRDARLSKSDDCCRGFWSLYNRQNVILIETYASD